MPTDFPLANNFHPRFPVSNIQLTTAHNFQAALSIP